MVQTLIYRGSGDNGDGVYAHIIGTDYTYEVTQYDAANLNYNNTFSQAGNGFVFRSADDVGGYGALYYSTGTGVSLLATDDNGNAISVPTAFSVFAGESVFVGTNQSVTNNALPKVLMTTNGGNAPSVLLPEPIELYTQAGGYIWATTSGGDLYRIDENRNTTLIYDRNDTNRLDIDAIFEFKGALYLRGDVSLANDFYRVDPATGAITELNIGENGGGDSIYFWYGGVGDSKFYFWWHDAGGGFELYASDGTSGGTSLVEDIRPGTSGSYVGSRTSPITVGDKLYFRADSGTGDGEELWVSDGTEPGTFALSGTGTAVGPMGFDNSMSAIALGTKLIFSASTGSGLEVYITDGTQAGTQLLIEINTAPSPFVTSTDPTFWKAADGKVYFSISSGSDSDSVWVTDGTLAGTRALSDPHSGLGYREPWLLNIVDLDIDAIPLQILNGTPQADDLRGTFVREIINGLDGGDMIFAGGGGGDVLNGGGGVDFARYDDADYGDIIVSLLNPALNTSAAAGDTFSSIEGLMLGAGNDWLQGDGGNNFLFGGAGSDTMLGGAGDDTYMVDEAGDVITELAGEGNDVVYVTDVGTYMLSANVEVGAAFGATVSLYGNAIANTLIGSGLNNVLSGEGGDDLIFGVAGGNSLFGGAGNDVLVSGTGAEGMSGGTGNDTYIIGAGDIVTEASGGGTDTLYSSLVSYVLTANVEIGVAIGTGRALYGNDVNNTLIGNLNDNVLSGAGGNDYLVGGLGSDLLIGGTGLDTLQSDTGADVMWWTSQAELGDIIVDWVAANDQLQFTAGAFFNFAGGSLIEGVNFISSANPFATTANATFLWDSDDTHLFFDADGNGAGGAVLVADFQAFTTLDVSDFQFV